MTTMSAQPDPPSRPGHTRAPRAPEPATLGARATGNDMVVKVFVVVPFLALCAAVPFAWGWGLSVSTPRWRRCSTWSPSPGSRSATTATSPTARSGPSAPSGSR